MRVLLPPSESKATRTRGGRLDLGSLSFPQLTDARGHVLDALATISARPDAVDVLGVSEGLRGEVERNLRLTQSPTLTASHLYTGVLYDALGLADLTGADKTRASRRILISSALYGVVRPSDRLAPYRLSMGVNLPSVGALASWWRERLTPVLDAECAGSLIVDCRSSTYAASWPVRPQLARNWVQIRVPGATHIAKHTRGLVTGHLVRERKAPSRPVQLADCLKGAFDVQLHEPKNDRSPWIADVATA